MSISLISKNTSLTLYLISFPILFFYSFGYSKGYFPAIPWPGYSLIVHLFSIFFIVTYCINYKNHSSRIRSPVFIWISLYCLYALLISLTYLIFGSGVSASIEVFNQSFVSLFYIFINSLLMYSFFYYGCNNNKINYINFLIIIIIILTNINPGSVSLFLLKSVDNNLPIINYQIVSFIIIMSWFVLFFSKINKYSKIFITIATLLMLTASGGRSELFGFVFSLSFIIMIYLMTQKVERKIFFIFILSIVMALAISVLYGYSDIFESIFKNSRHLEVNHLDTSTSWTSRLQLFNQNITKVIDSPIFGDYGGFVNPNNINKGTYIHNFFSVWMQYGIFALSIYLFIPIYCLFTLISTCLKNKGTIYHYAALFLCSYSLLLISITKSFQWSYFGLFIGIYAYAYSVTIKKELSR